MNVHRNARLTPSGRVLMVQRIEQGLPGVPDTAWVTDITYVKTMEGFAYLAVVIDLSDGHC